MGPVSPTEGVSRSRPVAIAITGGIGAGKTEALNAFARHGAATISSDDIVHRLLREDEDVRSALLERFGTGILDDAGHIDRAAISRIVFDDRRRIAFHLERIVEQRTRQRKAHLHLAAAAERIGRRLRGQRAGIAARKEAGTTRMQRRRRVEELEHADRGGDEQNRRRERRWPRAPTSAT